MTIPERAEEKEPIIQLVRCPAELRQMIYEEIVKARRTTRGRRSTKAESLAIRTAAETLNLDPLNPDNHVEITLKLRGSPEEVRAAIRIKIEEFYATKRQATIAETETPTSAAPVAEPEPEPEPEPQSSEDSATPPLSHALLARIADAIANNKDPNILELVGENPEIDELEKALTVLEAKRDQSYAAAKAIARAIIAIKNKFPSIRKPTENISVDEALEHPEQVEDYRTFRRLATTTIGLPIEKYIKLLQLGIEATRKEGRPSETLGMLIKLATAYKNNRRYEEALQTFEEILRFQAKESDQAPEGIKETVKNIAMMKNLIKYGEEISRLEDDIKHFQVCGDFQKALEAAEQLLNLQEQAGLSEFEKERTRATINELKKLMPRDGGFIDPTGLNMQSIFREYRRLCGTGDLRTTLAFIEKASTINPGEQELENYKAGLELALEILENPTVAENAIPQELFLASFPLEKSGNRGLAINCLEITLKKPGLHPYSRNKITNRLQELIKRRSGTTPPATATSPTPTAPASAEPVTSPTPTEPAFAPTPPPPEPEKSPLEKLENTLTKFLLDLQRSSKGWVKETAPDKKHKGEITYLIVPEKQRENLNRQLNDLLSEDEGLTDQLMAKITQRTGHDQLRGMLVNNLIPSLGEGRIKNSGQIIGLILNILCPGRDTAAK